MVADNHLSEECGLQSIVPLPRLSVAAAVPVTAQAADCYRLAPVAEVAVIGVSGGTKSHSLIRQSATVEPPRPLGRYSRSWHAVSADPSVRCVSVGGESQSAVSHTRPDVSSRKYW